MTCLCGEILELPPRGEMLECKYCHRQYKEIDDWGWWGYSCEIYVPVKQGDINGNTDCNK